MKNLTLPVAVMAAFFMSGCSLLQPGASVIASGIDEACELSATSLGLEARREIVASINAETSVGNHTPSDCDGDGLPDFAIDASGMPVPAP